LVENLTKNMFKNSSVQTYSIFILKHLNSRSRVDSNSHIISHDSRTMSLLIFGGLFSLIFNKLSSG